MNFFQGISKSVQNFFYNTNDNSHNTLFSCVIRTSNLSRLLFFLYRSRSRRLLRQIRAIFLVRLYAVRHERIRTNVFPIKNFIAFNHKTISWLMDFVNPALHSSKFLACAANRPAFVIQPRRLRIQIINIRKIRIRRKYIMQFSVESLIVCNVKLLKVNFIQKYTSIQIKSRKNYCAVKKKTPRLKRLFSKTILTTHAFYPARICRRRREEGRDRPQEE